MRAQRVDVGRGRQRLTYQSSAALLSTCGSPGTTKVRRTGIWVAAVTERVAFFRQVQWCRPRGIKFLLRCPITFDLTRLIRERGHGMALVRRLGRAAYGPTMELQLQLTARYKNITHGAVGGTTVTLPMPLYCPSLSRRWGKFYLSNTSLLCSPLD